MKIGILISNEVEEVIKNKAKKMGTSKRNIITLALFDILRGNITEEYINTLRKQYHLNYSTTFTTSEELKERVDGMNKYGLSTRVFIGYLLCDHFREEATSPVIFNDGEKEYIQIVIDKQIKEKIRSYCSANAIDINILFVDFILNKNISVRDYKIHEKDMLLLTLSSHVKEIINKNVSQMSINYRTYLNLVANQICKDLNL